MALATKVPRIPGLEAPHFPGLEAPPRQACSTAEGLLSPGKGSNFLSGATLGDLCSGARALALETAVTEHRVQ